MAAGEVDLDEIDDDINVTDEEEYLFNLGLTLETLDRLSRYMA